MVFGEYIFGIVVLEWMIVVKGILVIKCIGDEEWLIFNSGELFEVVGNLLFDL